MHRPSRFCERMRYPKVRANLGCFSMYQPQMMASLFAGTVLHLGAAKSATGHAETAAGAIGMIRAAEEHASVFQQPILHLAAPNPHAISILDSARKEGSLLAVIPRQVNVLPSGSSSNTRQ